MRFLASLLCAAAVSSPVKIGEYQFRWVKSEAHPTISLPLLAAYPAVPVMKAVNADLTRKLGQLGCEEAGEWETKVDIHYAADKVLSIQIRSNYNCGGAAHPGESDDTVTYDLETGKEVSFDGLFKDYTKRREEILRALFAGRVDDSAAEVAAGQCPEKWPYSEVAEWTLHYYLDKTGIVVYPEFPHVMAACSFEVRTPHEKLQKLGPGELLKRFATRAR